MNGCSGYLVWPVAGRMAARPRHRHPRSPCWPGQSKPFVPSEIPRTVRGRRPIVLDVLTRIPRSWWEMHLPGPFVPSEIPRTVRGRRPFVPDALTGAVRPGRTYGIPRSWWETYLPGPFVPDVLTGILCSMRDKDRLRTGGLRSKSPARRHSSAFQIPGTRRLRGASPRSGVDTNLLLQPVT